MLKVFIEERCEKITESGCWIWMKCLQHGYGNFRRTRKESTYLAHRAAWEAFKGPIPEGLHVLHRCDVRACCNPEHLFLGTNLDNIHDSMQKGRRKGITRRRPSGLSYHYNTKPGPKEKLTAQQKDEIRHRYKTEHISQRALGAHYGVSDGTVCRLLKHNSQE